MAKIADGNSSTGKVKLVCSYGGRIQSRSQDQQLCYVGGDTKILTIDRDIKLPEIVARLQTLCNFKGDSICIKYKLPDEELDVLISVINEDDLENMMIEYDRLEKTNSLEKPVRFRIFISSIVDTIDEAKQDSDKDVSANPDYLFGFDKDYGCVKAINDGPPNPQGFDLGLWSIPKATITGNTCSVNLNGNQESREVHLAANGVQSSSPVALVYNVPIPAHNGGFQTADQHGVGKVMMPVHSVNGYGEQQLYFMAPPSVNSVPPHRKKKTAAAPPPQAANCMPCSHGNVVNNQVHNV